MHDVMPATRRTANLVRADSMPGVGVTAHGIILASCLRPRVDGQRHTYNTCRRPRRPSERERERAPLTRPHAGIRASSFVLGTRSLAYLACGSAPSSNSRPSASSQYLTKSSSLLLEYGTNSLAIPEDWLACLRWSFDPGSPKYGRNHRNGHSTIDSPSSSRRCWATQAAGRASSSWARPAVHRRGHAI